MSAKKILILPLCLSVAGHLAVLSLMSAGGRQTAGETSAEEVITVNLKQAVEKSRSKKEGEKRPAVPARWQSGKTAVGALPEGYDADTVDLGSTDSRYTPYLKQLKKRIEKRWMYPEGAYARKEEGVTVVKFSVARNGKLDMVILMTSSGSPLLDEGTLGAIRAAAPYEPLPSTLHISRLNIVAAFRYRLAD